METRLTRSPRQALPAAGLLALILAGCALPPPAPGGHMPHAAGPTAQADASAMPGPHAPGHHGMGVMARADLAPASGSAVTGSVMFHDMGPRLMVHARVAGLKPGQEHGFHIHDKGDCAGGDGMATGGHFNPHGTRHGSREGEHHAGDLPSLKADERGVAELRLRLTGLSLGSGPADILGRGLIVHAQPDDYVSQPTGNAGARIACGVITPAR